MLPSEVTASFSQDSGAAFCSSLKADFQGSQVTSDAGLLLVRELDERFGLGHTNQSKPVSQSFRSRRTRRTRCLGGHHPNGQHGTCGESHYLLSD
jgi:hypothetical protein